MLGSGGAAVMLLSGKILRVLLFMVFLAFLFQGAKSLATYSREQIIFFYLSYNLIDTLAQLFFREVYRFRSLVVSGNFIFPFVFPKTMIFQILVELMFFAWILLAIEKPEFRPRQKFMADRNSGMEFRGRHKLHSRSASGL